MSQARKKNSLKQFVFASTILLVPAAQAFTISTINPPPGPTYDTSLDGSNSVVVTSVGQVMTVNPMIVDGIDINTLGGTVTLDPANLYSGAAISIGGTGNGIGVVAGGSNAVINIGSNTSIDIGPANPATNNAIQIANSGATINNAGTLQVVNNGEGSVINIVPGGNNTTINNQVGSFVQGRGIVGAGTLPTIAEAAGVTGLVINNNGYVNQTNQTVDTIQINGSFTSITNQSNGTMIQTDINGGSNAGGHTLNITPTGSGGNITNMIGGVINGGARPDTVMIQGNIGTLLNVGTISNSNTVLPANATGNAISINTNGANPITIAGIINAGAISANNPANATIATIGGAAPVIIENGFVNTGIIYSGNNKAIDFQTTTPTIAMVIQQSGSIKGDVLLASQAPLLTLPVFVMSGGTVAGNVTAASANPNILNVSGGSVTGSLNFGNKGDTLALSGGSIHNIVGNSGVGNTDIVVITGGNFDFLNTSTVAGSTTNVLIETTFTQNGTISGNGSTLTILTSNPGTIYTVNGPITGLSGALEVNSGTTFIPNNFIEFTGVGLLNNGLVTVSSSPVFSMTGGALFLNSGTPGSLGVLTLNPNATLTINDAATNNVFTGQAGSTIYVEAFGPMAGPVISGQMIVNSQAVGSVVELAQNSLLVPQFSGFIPQGALLNVITVNDPNIPAGGGTITNNATLVPYPSAIVSFAENMVAVEGVSETLQLIANRNSYSSFADGPAVGVAGTLDVLAQGAGPSDNDLYTLLSNLDQLATGSEVDNAMDSLTPPFNFGLIEASHLGMDSVFEGVTDRVWDVAWHHRDHGRRHSGKPLHRHPQNHKAQAKAKTNSGKSHGDHSHMKGVWLRPLVAYVNQSEQDDVDGYKARAWGAVLGFDWGLTDCTTIGAAVSYTHVNVEDKSWAPKDEKVDAWMGTLYGSFDFSHGIFFDAMVAGSHNDNEVNRVIWVNDLLTGAHASFDGSQWGVQGDLGIALPNVDFFLAPFVRLKWVQVSFDDYTETGAGDLALTVSNQDASEFLGGIGIRMAGDVSHWEIEWVPELTAMLAYDFTNDGEATTANFIGGGPQFATNGVTPGKTIFDLGLGLNALIGSGSVITAKYNLELRESFVANAGYLQYFYNWS